MPGTSQHPQQSAVKRASNRAGAEREGGRLRSGVPAHAGGREPAQPEGLPAPRVPSVPGQWPPTPQHRDARCRYDPLPVWWVICTHTLQGEQSKGSFCKVLCF